MSSKDQRTPCYLISTHTVTHCDSRITELSPCPCWSYGVRRRLLVDKACGVFFEVWWDSGLVFPTERETVDGLIDLVHTKWVANRILPLSYPEPFILLSRPLPPVPLLPTPLLCTCHSHLSKPAIMDRKTTYPCKHEGVHINNLQIPLGMDSRFSQEVLGAGVLKNPMGKKLPPGDIMWRWRHDPHT